MPYVDFISQFYQFVQSFMIDGGYLVLFFLTAMEGIPVVGMAVPGHVAILFAGFLAKINILNIFIVFIVSLTGALIGDFLGFIIGKKYGFNFIKNLKPYFFIKEEQINKTCLLLSKHTGKALIIGRFTPATRALMPFLVGATSAISFKKFWFFNIIGGTLWILCSVLIGYVFGSAYHIISKEIGKILVIALIITGLSIWGYRFANRYGKIFRQYELYTLILNLVALWGLAYTIYCLKASKFNLSIDLWLNKLFESFATASPLIRSIADTISNIGGVYSMLFLGFAVSIYYILKEKWRSAMVMVSAISLTAISSGLMKTIFMNPRPNNALNLLADPSFPSSHASMSIAFFTIITYLLLPRFKTLPHKNFLISISLLFVLVIGASRLILNVHWFSDIIGGWSLGIFSSTLSILAIRYASFLFPIIKKHD